MNGADCKYIKFVAAAWCIRKWLRLYQIIINPSSGDLRIPLVVIRLGVTMVVYLLDLFERRGE